MSTVTLSNNTLNVLRNYSTINSSIVFRKGNTVRTISNAENILAKFTSEEVFPMDFAIYDLSQFLSGINLFSNPRSLSLTTKIMSLFVAVVSLLVTTFLILRLRSNLLQKKM